MFQGIASTRVRLTVARAVRFLRAIRPKLVPKRVDHGETHIHTATADLQGAVALAIAAQFSDHHGNIPDFLVLGNDVYTNVARHAGA